MKKIFKILIMLVVILIIIFLLLNLKNYLIYKKTILIISDSIEKVKKIDNVSIEIKTSLNGQYSENNNQNKILIKNNSQCDTNNRKNAEENNFDYRVLNLDENICYTILTHYNNKEIHINTSKEIFLYTVELLKNIQIIETKLVNSYKYKITYEKIDDILCYKIKIYNENVENYENNYWISRENGLLMKSEINFYNASDKSYNTSEYLYIYEFNTVTDEDVKLINLDDYKDYKIIDNTKSHSAK